MSTATTADCQFRSRNLLFLSTPVLWPHWPFLPLVRRNPGKELECGLLCDVFRLNGTGGASATVYLCNLLLLPPTLEEFLALPKKVYNTPEEIYAAGWRVD